jgi:ApaG protein
MAARALYRAFLSTARELERRSHPVLLVQTPVQESRVQWYKPAAPQSEYIEDSLATMLRQRFPWVAAEQWPEESAREITPSQVREVIRRAFRAPPPPEGLDAAFGALRELHAQVELMRCTSVTTSEAAGGVRVRVEATSCYRGKQGPAGPWVFQYRIRIANEGEAVVRLLGREWQIRNADGSLHASVPKGSPGVVGETPTLEPGQAFEYASGTTFSQPGGTVEGSFQMVAPEQAEAERDAGMLFDAAVGRFECVVEGAPGGGRTDAG